MVHIPPLEHLSEKRILRSMEAFLQTEQNLPWVLGVIDKEQDFALKLLTTTLDGYGDPTRHMQLEQELEKPGQ